MGSKDKLRAYLEANVGKVLKTATLRKVAGVSEYARRLRELRDQEGMQIRSHIDRHDLKPGEYVLESLKRIPMMGRGISPQLRNEILERNGFTCQLFGGGLPRGAPPRRVTAASCVSYNPYSMIVASD